MEFDLECNIPDCDGKMCRPDKTQIAKIRRVSIYTELSQYKSYEVKQYKIIIFSFTGMIN